MGKLMPLLVGESITGANLNELIESLLLDCACLRSPSSLGVDIPMTWDKSLAAAVVPARIYNGNRGVLGGLLNATGSSASPLEWRALSTTVWTLGLLVLVVGIAAVVIVRPKDRNRRAG